MLKKLKQSNQGFTIIEVLIVLAIAGLILLIVFLAVPALQRNQRNTSRKNDVARVGGAATEYASNNNGTLPPAGAGTPLTNSTGPLSQYAAADVTVVAGAHVALVPATDATKMVVNTSAKCGAGGATVAGTSKQMSIQYMTETNGSAVPLCQDV